METIQRLVFHSAGFYVHKQKSLENKSTGPTSIPRKLLTLIPDLNIVPFAYIINMSLQTGEYPDLLKMVKVIPIHKGGST